MDTELTNLSKNFAAVAKQLSGDGALNYVVSFGIFPSKGNSGKGVKEIVSRALGHQVEIEGLANLNTEGALERIRRGFSYSGDHGAHPSMSYISSDRFQAELDAILLEARAILDLSQTITDFRLVKGDPFSGGFPWQFSFCAEMGKDAYVWIGSSSD